MAEKSCLFYFTQRGNLCQPRGKEQGGTWGRPACSCWGYLFNIEALLQHLGGDHIEDCPIDEGEQDG